MRNFKNSSRRLLVLLSVGLSVIQACKHDVGIDPSAEGNITSKPRAVYSSHTVNWTGRTSADYTVTNFASDFGNGPDFEAGHMRTVGDGLEFKLFGETEAEFTGGGISPNVDIVDGSEYEVEYKLKFHSAFVWGKGGKLGFGLKIGNGYNGCDANAGDGGGGSARVMWYTYSNGDVTLRPYVYHKDMIGPCGDYLTGRYPATGSLQRGVWYTVKMRVKSNTGTLTNGHISYIINGVTILDQDIRWTTDDTKRLINIMSFHTHRGGGSDWTATEDSKMYYEYVKWTKIS